ncbi:nucleotidyl transferase AbiEii/AbiGii toxin family protein [Desulfurobacterium sp. TC5-1]|uniref:nucleotidyl transferase AbiEii/AbiGii toxin family protein n=1 Tax=Desulfurobacterium sp. TC5-1 TaxID=1158318 RepID=UPI0003B370A9|nr:nucleotidyl transferase AbiEii/AbiGii toxin family protein [Desulfurobacterium sp. TC5-1]
MEHILKWKLEILDLLNKAISCLKTAGIPYNEWSFGGGSALMFRYWHRESKDVDIFLTNPQYITMLSPRLNEYAESIATDYKESSVFIKILVENREIDFIVAPNLSGKLPVKKTLDSNMEIFVEQPEEILVKKFFYRTESLKIRDFLDAYIVLKDPLKTESTRLIFRNFLKRKEETLRKRAAYLQKVVKSEGILNTLQKLSVSPFLIGKVPENFIQTVVKEIFEKKPT